MRRQAVTLLPAAARPRPRPELPRPAHLRSAPPVPAPHVIPALPPPPPPPLRPLPLQNVAPRKAPRGGCCGGRGRTHCVASQQAVHVGQHARPTAAASPSACQRRCLRRRYCQGACHLHRAAAVAAPDVLVAVVAFEAAAAVAAPDVLFAAVAPEEEAAAVAVACHLVATCKLARRRLTHRAPLGGSPLRSGAGAGRSSGTPRTASGPEQRYGCGQLV
eukprot:355434-Chlamydomonas_euryale.AAC.6